MRRGYSTSTGMPIHAPEGFVAAGNSSQWGSPARRDPAKARPWLVNAPLNI